MPARDRNERRFSDDEIRAVILTQASTAMGASKVLLKDRFYAYPDREAVGTIIGDLVRSGDLITASYKCGGGGGRISVRAFVHKHHADAFAAGKGVPTRSVVKPTAAQKAASQAPQFPRLHDMLDPLGSSRGPALTLLRKPGSSVRKADMPMSDKAPSAEAVITERTRITIAPTCTDQRYTVRELPAGYRSALDPREARPWAQAAAGSRAA